MNLTPDTRYDVLVCLPRLDEADLTSSTSLSLRDCGFCSFCFRTAEVSFDILLTETSPLSSPLVNLTCQIQSNVDFNIEWRVATLDPETGNIRRERLDAGELFDMEPIEISQTSIAIEETGFIIVTSELIISDSIFEMENVDCRARSPFRDSQPSMPGAFIPGTCRIVGTLASYNLAKWLSTGIKFGGLNLAAKGVRALNDKLDMHIILWGWRQGYYTHNFTYVLFSVEPSEDPDLNRTVEFPVWGIALLVVLPILIITFLVIVIVAICIVLTWKRKKLIELQDEGQR